MDTMSAFAMGQANRNKELKVFDWDKAARLLCERSAANAVAGLASDMEWTSGTILRDGAIVDDSYTYLASTWATPVLVIDGEEIDCYRMESECPAEWTGDKAKVVWPESARVIFESK